MLFLIRSRQVLANTAMASHRRVSLTSARWHASRNNTDSSIQHELPKALSIGGIAGLLGSLAGMGGGFVMIPLMTGSLLKLTQHQAHGTSLFAVAATGMAGALGYADQVQWEAAAVIAASGIITARLGATMTAKLSERALKKSLGTFMICVAPTVPLKQYFIVAHPSTGDTTNKEPRSVTQRLLPPAMIGLGSGFMAGLFGVGGGAIVVPALTLFTDMNHYQALGTSLCAMTLPAMMGTYTHYTKGHVVMRVAPTLAFGSFVGAYLGGKLIGLQTNENVLRWGFSGLMLALGARTLIKV
jgi:uncharacterized protein